MTATDVAVTSPFVQPDELLELDAYRRAAKYLSVGQIHLVDNPLLRGPLLAEHVNAAGPQMPPAVRT